MICGSTAGSKRERNPSEIRAPGLSHFAGHDEKRLHFEAGVMWPETVDIVLLFHIHNFFRGSDRVDREVVVTAIPEDDKSPVNLAEEQVQREVAVSHGNDGINGV